MGSKNGWAPICFEIKHVSLELQRHTLYHVCHIRIIETGHSKITLILQLNQGLQNWSIIVKCPQGVWSRRDIGP